MIPLPPVAALLSRLLPCGERDAIVGDLLEDAAYRDLTGSRLALWLCGECAAVAAGIAVDRLRASFVPPVRDMAAGLALDGTRKFRQARNGPVNALLSVLLFCASAVVIAFSAEVLVSALFSASGLRR